MAKVWRTPWTPQQVEAYREWHERRMAQLDYPREIQESLRQQREQYLNGCQ